MFFLQLLLLFTIVMVKHGVVTQQKKIETVIYK